MSPKKQSENFQMLRHVSTPKLLNEQRLQKKRKRKKPNPSGL